MNKILKGVVVGGAIGVIAPVTMAVANEFLWSHYNGKNAGPQICFAERLWNLQRIKVVHAKGCRNKILDSIPFCLLIGVLGGSLISSLSLITKETQKKSKDTPADPASASTPTPPVTGIKPPIPAVENKLTIPSISVPFIYPQINQGVDRLKGLDWNTITKGTVDITKEMWKQRTIPMIVGVSLIGSGIWFGIIAVMDSNSWKNYTRTEPNTNNNSNNGGQISQRVEISITELCTTIGCTPGSAIVKDPENLCTYGNNAISNAKFEEMLTNGYKVVTTGPNIKLKRYQGSWEYDCTYANYIMEKP